MDFADVKARLRQTVHETFATAASYTFNGVTTPITARWSTKLALNGDLGGDYATIIENVDRLIFLKTDTVQKHGVVTLTKYGVSFELDTPVPGNGAVYQYWNVVPT